MLCDFGSTTTRAKVYETTLEISEEEENIRRTTTPAYRAPEVSSALGPGWTVGARCGGGPLLGMLGGAGACCGAGRHARHCW